MKVFTNLFSLLHIKNLGIHLPSLNQKQATFTRWIPVCILLIMTLGSYTVNAQLLQWNTFGNLGTETTEPSVFNDVNITSANLTQGTITPAANGNRFGGSGWFNTGNTLAGNTLAEAVAGNDYIQFIVTPNAGFSFTPTSLVFTWDRSGTGPSSVTLRSSADGFTADLGTVTGMTSGGVSTTTPRTLTISTLSNITVATTFRLYGYAATATGGTGGFDNASSVVDVQLNGTTGSAIQNQTISGFPLTNTKTFGIAPYNITGVTGGGSGNPVTFIGDNNLVATVVGTLVTITGAGTVNITASQAGNGSYNPAPNVVQVLTVGKASQTITFGALINRNDVDANFQLTATGGGSGNQVTYTSSNTAVAIIVDNIGNLDPNGSYVDIIGPGTTNITASQAGNSNYFAATSVQQLQTIINTSLLNQTITFNPLTNKTYGDLNFQLTATATPSGLPVTYTSSNPAVAVIVDNLGNLDPNGTYVDVVGPGNTAITASQAGNGTYNPAVSVPRNLTVDVKPLTVTGAVADNKVYNGSLVANISGASLVGIESPDIVNIATTPGTFADANVNVGPPIAVTASLTLGGADAVKYSLTQPIGLSANITKANQTINFALLANKSPGDANFNYTATASSGLPVSYSSSVPSVATIISGSLVHIGVIGASTITASQAGNGNYFAATPVLQTQNVVAALPASIFTNPITDGNPSLANPFTAGQVVNPNITVSGIGRGPGIVGTSASNRYNANTWNTAVFDATKYFEFTLTPNSGYRIDFSSFVYASQVSNITTSPTLFAVRSSLDGFTANIGSPVSGTAATTSTIPLSAASYQGLTTAITFRVYGWGGTSATSTFSINDFTFNGNVFVALPTATFTKTNVSVCGGVSDGTITVTPSGTGPFSYSWTGVTGSGNPATGVFPNPGNVASLTGLPIGYYNVTVTDGNLNTVTITGIHIQNAFSVFITNNGSISSACGNTGSIILYGNAGVLPYTYSLTSSAGPWQAGNTFTGLAAGPYIAYVKDGAGCVNSKAITVIAAAPIVVSPFSRGASSCANDGSIEIYRSGGIPPFSYSLDNITYQSITNKYLNLAAGPYTAYVKDSKGCISSAMVTVAQGVGLTLTANKTNASCINDGSIQLNASGGVAPYTYSIDGSFYQSSNSFSGLSANTYACYVKDAKGCTGGPLNITINTNSITVTAYAVTASGCGVANGSIQLFRTGGTGPYTYSLDGNTYQPGTTFTGLLPGYYEGYVKDSKACIGQLIDILVNPDGCPVPPTVTGTFNRSGSASFGEEKNAIKVQAYPNPSSNEFLLKLEGFSNEKVAILVTDIMGRKVFQCTGSGRQQYRFGNKFNAGMYHVQVIQGNLKQSVKIIKE